MQRGKGKFDYISYKFEFPGGKVEPGESRHEALERELREEMDMDVFIAEDDYLMTVDHSYPDFCLSLHAYLCRPKSASFTRKEHIEHKWMLPSEIDKLDWAEADIPIVSFLKATIIN